MRRFHLIIALGVLLLDRYTKWLVARDVSLHDSITVIKRVFYITHVENRGAAFGLFADSPSEWKIGLLVLFSIVALVIVSALLWKSSHTMTATGVGLSLILGGALGNFTQRLSREWSIETGQIEGVYDLDRGITQTLIERGIEPRSWMYTVL